MGSGGGGGGTAVLIGVAGLGRVEFEDAGDEGQGPDAEADLSGEEGEGGEGWRCLVGDRMGIQSGTRRGLGLGLVLFCLSIK